MLCDSSFDDCRGLRLALAKLQYIHDGIYGRIIAAWGSQCLGAFFSEYPRDLFFEIYGAVKKTFLALQLLVLQLETLKPSILLAKRSLTKRRRQ